MSRSLRLLVLLSFVVAAGLGAPVARADRAAADFFAQRGDKAVKDRKWAEAQEHYRKALEEDEHHVPARLGMGEAFFGGGDRAAAIEAWRRVAADADAVKPLPTGWADAVARAKKRLTELDAAGTALALIVDKQVADLVALAERWLTKDPEVAAAALRDALKLRPAHAKAAALFAKFGAPPADWVPLFDGRTLSGWDEAEPIWKVADGQMVADIHTGTYIVLSKKGFEGDFDIRIEAKFLEKYEGVPVFAFGGAMRNENVGTTLGIGSTEVSLRERDGPERTAQHNVFYSMLENLADPFDPQDWTTYELQFRGKEVRVTINGKELCIRERAPGREGGKIALIVQSILLGVRKIEVLQR